MLEPGSPGAPEASGPLSLLPPEAPGSRGAPLSPGLESGALRYPGFPEGGALESLEPLGCLNLLAWVLQEFLGHQERFGPLDPLGPLESLGSPKPLEGYNWT